MMDVEPVVGDARFFARSGPHPLAAVALAARGEAPARTLMLSGVAPLQTAGPADVSFLDNRRYADLLDGTKAGAVIVHPDLAGRVPPAIAGIVTREPYLGWAAVAALFHPLAPMQAGVHATAVVDPAATVDATAQLGPFVVVGARAVVGARCRIDAHAVLGDGVVLGADCRVGAHASLSHALVGDRVAIYPGARIGQDGFGFATGPAGFVSVPQLGRVVIGDDVEIGANTAIDRGSAHDTVIGAGSRLDNLVMIGHNVRLGRCCVIVSQAGISGSTVLGDFVQVAGQAGVAGHLTIGAKARIGAQAGIMADVAAGLDVIGSPAMPVRAFFRQVAWLRRMAGQPAARGGQGKDGAATSVVETGSG